MIDLEHKNKNEVNSIIPTNEEKHFTIIGHPIVHSISPIVHNLILNKAGINGNLTFTDINPDNFESEFLPLLKSLDGVSCTIPFKVRVIQYLDSLDIGAQMCQSVNVIYNKIGYNTDIVGFESSSPNPCGKKVLLLGAGGVAHSIAYSLIRRGASQVAISEIDQAKAHELSGYLINQFNFRNVIVFDENSLTDYVNTYIQDSHFEGSVFDMIVNATPVGMWPKVDRMPIKNELLKKLIDNGLTDVFDTIYNPVITKLMMYAELYGANICNGSKMVFNQALYAEKIWNSDYNFDSLNGEFASIISTLNSTVCKDYPMNYVFCNVDNIQIDKFAQFIKDDGKNNFSIKFACDERFVLERNDEHNNSLISIILTSKDLENEMKNKIYETRSTMFISGFSHNLEQVFDII